MRYFLLLLSCVISLTAMENMCYLALMPTDIKNKIAEYLIFIDRESDNEAKARMQISKLEDNLTDHPPLWDQYHVDFNKYYEPGTGYRADRKFHIFSKSNKFIMVLDSGPWGYSPRKGDPAPFALYDTKTNAKLHEDCFWHKDFGLRHAAISNDGNYCAFITEALDVLPYEIIRPGKFTLTIRNLTTSEEFAFPLSDAPPIYTSIDSIHFNKQSTKVIIKGWGDFPNNLPAREDGFLPEENFKHVDLFQITSDAEDKEKSKKTLELYLYRKTVCKQLQNSSL